MAALAAATASSRRFGVRHANPYQSSYAHHKAVASSSGGRHPRDGDDSSNAHEDAKTKPSPRKRVVVACGRCRKRKIRCSGDDGSGSPCINCRNAGEPNCLFLRVASQETAMRAASNSFNYSLEACRRYQSRGSTIIQPMHLVPGGSPQGTMASQMDDSFNLYSDANQTNAGNTFRGDQSYVYASRDYALQNWNQGNSGFPADGNMGYNMYQQPFPSLAVQDTSYMYQQGDHTSASMTDRSATALAEAGAFSLQNIAQGLPQINDRLLPSPSQRPLPSTIVPSSRDSTTSSLYSRTSYPSTATGSPAATALTEMSPNYSFEDSTGGQYSAVPMLPSHAVQRMPGMYTTSQPEAMLSSQAETLPSRTTPSLTYRYQDTTRRADIEELSPESSLGSSFDEPSPLDGPVQRL